MTFYTITFLSNFRFDKKFLKGCGLKTVYADMANLVSKVVRDLKVKSPRTAQRWCAKCRGGSQRPPPNLFSVKGGTKRSICLWMQNTIITKMHFTCVHHKHIVPWYCLFLTLIYMNKMTHLSLYDISTMFSSENNRIQGF